MDHSGAGPHRVWQVREVALRMDVGELEDEVLRVGGVLGEGMLTGGAQYKRLMGPAGVDSPIWDEYRITGL